MKILITYALEVERGNIHIPDCELTFCCTGVGKVSTAINTYEALLMDKPDLVLNIGTAGTLNRGVGEVVVCSAFLDRDLEKIAHLGIPYHVDFSDALTNAGCLDKFEAKGVVSTGDTFLTDHDENASHADVFDMEAFAGALVCKKLNIPYLSIKYVTDIIGQNSIKHWAEKLQDAREGLAAYLEGLRF